jgi:hypothetical protein
MDGGVGYGGGAIGNKVGINGGVINGPPRHSNDKRHLSSEEELNWARVLVKNLWSTLTKAMKTL